MSSNNTTPPRDFGLIREQIQGKTTTNVPRYPRGTYNNSILYHNRAYGNPYLDKGSTEYTPKG